MFKQFVSVVLIASMFLMLAGCGSDRQVQVQDPTTKTFTYNTYSQYGLFNADEMKNPNVAYRPIIGNIVWGIIFCETFIVPLIIVGWFLFEPVGTKVTGVNAVGTIPNPSN